YVYLTGATQGELMTSAGALRRTYGGGPHDAFVAKLNPDASSGSDSLIYSSYFGGSGDDLAFGIAVDADGSAYITGRTNSLDLPLAYAAQPGLGGDTDAFVAKLNDDGSALIFATYLGGSGADEGRSIAVNAGGQAYVTGSTSSPDFPTANAVQGMLNGKTDAFLTRLESFGAALVYSTYLG